MNEPIAYAAVADDGSEAVYVASLKEQAEAACREHGWQLVPLYAFQPPTDAEIDALECVVEDGRIATMIVYGHLRSLLVRLRPKWEFDRSKPVKDVVSDRSKPINDERLAALEELSALDQKLELEYGITGNPMIKAQRNNESI